MGPLAGTRPDQFPLELGKATQHGQHQSAMRRRGVGPTCLSDRLNSQFSPPDRGVGLV